MGLRQVRTHTLLVAAVSALTLCLSGWSSAQIYKVTEGDSVEFTDRPATPDANRKVEKMELEQTNSAPAVQPKAATTPSQEPQEAPPVMVSIVSPAPETTVAMGPGNFSVSASTSPSLGRNEQLQLLIDGQPYGTPQSGSSWFVEGALRGEHQLRVARLTAGGAPLAESDSVRIYVLRPSVIGR